MASVTPSNQSRGVVNFADGTLTGDATATTVTLGFVPRHVRIFNETDVIVWEKFKAQAAANTVKVVAAGTMTKDTTSAIVINTDGTITLTAALAASGKVIHWSAWG